MLTLRDSDPFVGMKLLSLVSKKKGTVTRVSKLGGSVSVDIKWDNGMLSRNVATIWGKRMVVVDY